MIVIDIEASGLAEESYPIEIGWYDLDSGRSDAFLINPATSQDDWSHWDEVAEGIHGIAKEHLVIGGIDVRSACRRLNIQLSGKVAYSDALDWDRFWIRTLFDGAGLTNQWRQQFKLNDIETLIRPEFREEFRRRLAELRPPHRALSDAKLIAQAFSSLPPEALL